MTRNICVLTSAHPPRDVRIFHKECKSLARAGYDVTLIAPFEKDGEYEGIKLVSLPRWKNRLDRVIRGSFWVYQKACEADAEIYHFHDPELIPVALLLQLSGKKVVYDIHEDLPRTISYKPYIPNPFRGSISRLAEVLEHWAGSRFSALVAATPGIANRFRGVNKNAVVVNNFPKIEEIEQTSGAPAEKLDATVVYVGWRITRARGAEEMIRAMGLLPGELHARLKLVGTWDPPELPGLLSNIPGWDRTDFVGPLGRAEVAAELRKACAGLVILHPEPNYVNSQPVKLFEYMCAAIPVIASDFPVCRDIIMKTGCGFVVDPLKPEAIARAMQYFLTHPKEARDMGQRGLQAVRERYNWANEEKTLLSIYRRLFNPDAAYQSSLVDTGAAP